MTVQDLIEFLGLIENKDLPVFLKGEGGFYTPCYEDSGVCDDEDGEMVVLMPCYGHDDIAIEVEVRPDEFEINQN